MLEQRLFHCVIDRAFIERRTFKEVLDPVYHSAHIYGSLAAFEASLRGFSVEQRAALAAYWYQAEVNNGGHWQFFLNSTGVVWRHALEGLTQLGQPAYAAVLRQAALRLGGSVPFTRRARERRVDEFEGSFDDLDQALYALERQESLCDRLLRYMRAHPEAFLFEGFVEKPWIPPRP
jgi:hypothetical protein